MLNTTKRQLDAAQPAVLSLFRVVISLLFICHGASSVLGAFGGPDGGQPSTGAWPSWWAGLIQLVGGGLVLLGIGEMGTRFAALANSGSMAYAYFTVHQEQALWPIENHGELSAVFCWSFLLIAALGPGPWALTSLVGKFTATRTPTPRTPAPKARASHTT